MEGILNKKQETINFDKNLNVNVPGIILHDKVVDMQTKKVVKHGQSMLEETVTTFLFIITMKQGAMNHVITL